MFCAPAYFAAETFNIPNMQYEQNAKPGIANKLGAVKQYVALDREN